MTAVKLEREIAFKTTSFDRITAPITTAADDIHKNIFRCFSEKIRLDVSSESFATHEKSSHTFFER